MDYSVRSGDRDALIETLRQLASDRGERGQSERAADARRAAAVLESGSDGAYYDRVLYVVGEADRYSVVGDTREGVLAQLADAAKGWDHQGKTQLTVQATDAMVRVREGADVARVGHIVYMVRA